MTINDADDVVSYDDYYPFGLQIVVKRRSRFIGMPGRSYNQSNVNGLYKYSSKELDNENLPSFIPFDVSAVSKGFDDGNYAEIRINGNLVSGYGLYGRGYTLVTINANGVVLDSDCFDTHAYSYAAEDMADFINYDVSNGEYVIGVVRDEASAHMTEEAYDALESLGCSQPRSVGYRDSYVFIARKGYADNVKGNPVKRNDIVQIMIFQIIVII